MKSTISSTAVLSGLVAASLIQAQEIPQLVRKHTYQLEQRVATGVSNLNLRDQQRAASIGRHGGQVSQQSNIATPLSFFSAAGTSKDVPMDNDFSAYLIKMGVGSPAVDYTLLVDTGSANTWIDNTQGTYNPGSTGVDTGDDVGLNYGVSYGSFRGQEYQDTVTFQGPQGAVIAESQGLGIASSQSGFEGLGGILGLAPAEQTRNSLKDRTTGAPIDEIIPTVPDTLFAQGDIPVNTVGISFIPTTFAERTGAGTLTFGGTNPDEYIGNIMYFPKSTNPEVAPYWGFETASVTFDKLDGTTNTYRTTEFLSETHYGIIDTGSTLISLPEPVFAQYQAQIPGSMFNSRGMFLIPADQVPLLGNMTINIAGNDFVLSPSAQLFPNEIASLFGINVNDGYYLSVFGNTGFDSGDSFTLGMYFLERFYSVYDTTNQAIGLAYTEYTFDKTTETTAYRRTKRAHRVSHKRHNWVDGKSRLNKLSSRSPFIDSHVAQVLAKA